MIEKLTQEESLVTPHRLYRGRSDRMIFGICGGLAQYFAIDPTLVRIFFVLGAIFSHGALVLAYLIMLFVIPKEPFDVPTAATTEEGPGAAGSSDPFASWKGSSFFGGSDAGPFGFVSDDIRQRRNQWIGWGLLGLGLLILASNLHLLSWLSFGVTWPLFLIIAGAFLLMRHRQQI
jgi:phage shock protein C